MRLAGIDLSGGSVRPGSTDVLIEPDIFLFDDIVGLAAQSDVVIDFTHADTVVHHADALSSSGTGWILGTTGLSHEAQASVDRAARFIPIVQAANFSSGVALLLDLARRMAQALPAETYDAEILEMHHRQKVDAPSGTALALGKTVAEVRGVSLDDVRESGRDGHTGLRGPGAIGFAALRGGQIVGEHTLMFTSGSEQIALTHRAFDRRVFAAGAVRAALWADGRSPGLYGMEDVLGLR
ncbi:MAG: 4-hydroxy-tetrahydrodipicolinate reductase [Janthinobacterium lividum]